MPKACNSKNLQDTHSTGRGPPGSTDTAEPGPKTPWCQRASAAASLGKVARGRF